MRKNNVLHLTASVSREAGGLFSSVRQLSLGVAAFDDRFQVAIIGTHDASTDKDIPAWQPLIVKTHKIYRPKRFGYARGMTAALLDSDADLIHLHGLWQYPSIAVARWARRTGRPYIVSPHGMMEPWSLQQSRFKKKLAAWLYQWSCLANASCLRATSALEAQSIRVAGFKNLIAVVPNGVEVPASVQKSKTGDRKAVMRKVLFLSRIHPKKGLLNLIKAWHQVRPVGWELIIVGPDECGHLAEVRAAVVDSGLDNLIRFQGEVMGDAKTNMYYEADVFVLPSFSENFGLVIAEALVCGTPVITTRATPWEELETHRCGWWIETGVEPLAKALREATSLNDSERNEMGQRGRQLIENNYTWPGISRQMAEVYEWMLGQKPKPKCIFD